MGPCGKAAAGHEESNHTSGCSYFAILFSERGWERSAGFSWINLSGCARTTALHKISHLVANAPATLSIVSYKPWMLDDKP